MTLEQATEQTRAATMAGDLGALRVALAARRTAIDGIDDPARLEAALAAGESIAADLRLLKVKLAIDSNRLLQIQSALLTGLGAEHRPRINCKA
jgi:hypothetical protein